LTDAGYTVLTFDSRSFGESEGTPRFHYDPNEIIEDCSNAVSYMLTRGDIDPDNIALMGGCMGEGYAVSTAARDKRVKAAISVAGGYNIGGTFQQFLGVTNFANYYRKINDLITKQYQTGEVQYIPTIAQALSEEVQVAAMPNPEAYS
jgi:dipeptidyl aminopeptidase/acylaminoacyl peptidase